MPLFSLYWTPETVVLSFSPTSISSLVSLFLSGCLHTGTTVHHTACSHCNNISGSIAVGKLALYSGVLALGVGDSMAAVAGSLMGKTKWPGL